MKTNMTSFLFPFLFLLFFYDSLSAQWGTPVTVASSGNVGPYASLAIVNGNPAISYYDNTNVDLKYVRANDASGTAWGTPVTVASTGNVGQYTSLAIVDGNPAISYYAATNTDLKYVRASDASGTAWGTPVTPDAASVGQYSSLVLVNGNPAISYYDLSNNDLRYVRASDASGTAWGTPVTVASTDFVGAYTALAIVNGNPAISYYDQTNADLKYVRANDASGTAWETPVTVASTGTVGQYTSLEIVDGNPAISYYDGTNADLKYVRATNSSGVLPVELTGFQAKALDHAVLLTWRTASESDNEGFEVHRSLDGRHWENLAFVPGNGTTTEAHDYSFLDVTPLPSPLEGGRGVNYYRLKQVDFDGNFEHSKTLAVELKNTAGFLLFPNPARQGATALHLSETTETEAFLKIFDCMGRQVFSQKLELENGGQPVPVDLSACLPGIYLARLELGGVVRTERLAVAR